MVTEDMHMLSVRVVIIPRCDFYRSCEYISLVSTTTMSTPKSKAWSKRKRRQESTTQMCMMKHFRIDAPGQATDAPGSLFSHTPGRATDAPGSSSQTPGRATDTPKFSSHMPGPNLHLRRPVSN